jgi:hypothetical protein
LQALFAWKLLDRLTDGKVGAWRKTVATAFFVIAPVFVWRIHWHFALGAHWLLLAGFYLYFSPGLNATHWIILLLIASLVTPINLAMVLIIFVAALARQYFSREINLLIVVRTLAIAFLLLLFTMWQAGYFMVSEVGSGGFGEFRASVLGFIDPAVGDLKGDRSWSYIFPDLPQSSGNYEGFCFLGTGMILLLVITVCALVIRRPNTIDWKRHWPILLIFIFSIAFALSNIVAAGPFVLFKYNLPFIIEKLISPFRASGRFIWLAYYLLMAGGLSFVLARLPRNLSFTCLSICLVAQLADSSKAFVANRAAYDVNFFKFLPSLLDSQFWHKAAAKYSKVIYVPPAYATDNYIQLCYFAASNHLPISLCRTGRTDEHRLVTTRLNAVDEIDRHGFDADALYVFENPAIWARELAQLRTGDWTGTVDDYDVVAPGWQPGVQMDIRPIIQRLVPKCELGTELQFGLNSNARAGLAVGWGRPEAWGGVWSDGYESLLTLSSPDELKSDAVLDIDGMAFLNPKSKGDQQRIEVSVNSHPVGIIDFTRAEASGTRSVRIPRELFVNQNGITELKFSYSHAVSPAQLGLYLDSRIKAFGLRSLRLKPEGKP